MNDNVFSRAIALHARAYLIGFKWPDAAAAMPKLSEEVMELLAAINSGDINKIREELGDVLQATVSVAYALDFSPEVALSDANDKFARRIEYMEDHILWRYYTCRTQRGAAG